MKKILVFMICLMLVGCSTNKAAGNADVASQESLKTYNEILKMTKKSNAKVNPPFDYRLVYSSLEDGYRYDLVINNASITMKSIKALVYSDYLNDKYYATLGIFENASTSLKKNYVNKKEGYYKGFAISGKVKKESNLKLYISYINDNDKREEHIYEVKYAN